MAKVKEFQKVIVDDLDWKDTISGEHVCEWNLGSIPVKKYDGIHAREGDSAARVFAGFGWEARQGQGRGGEVEGGREVYGRVG